MLKASALVTVVGVFASLAACSSTSDTSESAASAADEEAFTAQVTCPRGQVGVSVGNGYTCVYYPNPPKCTPPLVSVPGPTGFGFVCGPKPPPPPNGCGPEIGNALQGGLQNVANWIANLGVIEHTLLCNNPLTYKNAVDFNDPSGRAPYPCGQGVCNRCVMVNGQAQWFPDVNYMLMGMVMYKCGWTYPRAVATVTAWKTVNGKANELTPDMWFWFQTGWNYTQSGGVLPTPSGAPVNPTMGAGACPACPGCNPVSSPLTSPINGGI